jgi:PAS domain S-box-containing protein
LRILIVDDHEPVRRSIRSLLAPREDLSICGEAADGFEATELARRLRPDLILMDMSMPRMDGAEAARIIKQELPGTQIIVVTQNDPALVRQYAAQIDARSFVSKATLARDLVPAILEAFARPEDVQSAVAADDLAGGAKWLSGGGDVGELMRRQDWSQTPLGPIRSWSPALRMMVKFLLANRFPQLLWWGPEFCSLYNDAYVPILGGKHPRALGQPVSEVWDEIWDVLKPLIETPFNGGPATWMEDIPLEINRRGFVEETHFTIAYSPVPDETIPSGIGGVLATVHEITQKVVAERRGAALRDLGARSVEPKSPLAACTIAVDTLARYSKDVPFVFVYLLAENRESAHLACGTGTGEPICPPTISLAAPATDQIWPVAKLLETSEIQLVHDLQKRFGRVPQGPWSDPPSTAALVPIRSNIPHQLAGFLVVGISARLQFDESYRDFLDLLSTQIATTIASARASEEERKRAEALAEINRAKTLFFSNVSHEFRTPLTLMLGPLEDTLSHPSTLPAEDYVRLKLAHRNSTRLLKLVNALLDFSRIEAGRMQAVYKPTDLAPFTCELAAMFRSATERAGLQLLVNCSRLSQPVYVDREMWEKIVFNLLSNAFKFTFQGEIELSLKESAGFVELSVRDTGTGIPPEDLPHLFERFYRVKGALGRTFEGSGIGLSLVQELVKLHGGTVRVASEINCGSTFTVSIPLGNEHLRADRLDDSSTLESSVRAESYVQEALRWLPDTEVVSEGVPFSAYVSTLESPDRSRMDAAPLPRILLADDNADMRDYVRGLLRGRYDVQTVPDGAAALQSARQRRPDLILSDVMMPRLDGFGLLQALRADEALKSIPVILLSARAGEEASVEGLRGGADDYLVKPFSARELIARVESHLAMARIRQEAANLERKLRLDAELLAAIVASSDDAIISKNLDGIITSWNKTAERMFGYAATEAIGHHITLIIPPDRHHEEAAIIQRLRRGEPIDHFQTVRVRKDGAAVDVSLSISPVRDSAGHVVGASKVARDITAQLSAEEALRQSEQRLRALVNASSYIVYRMSPDWSEMRELDGRGFISDTDKPNKNWLQEYIDPADQKLVLGTIQEAIRNKCLFELEHRVRRRDGTLGWTLSRAVPLLDARGEITEWFGAASDVTARKRAEENYRHLAETLESEVRARTLELENRNAEIVRQSELVREFSQRLLQAQDEERRHIARELHDSAGQTLTVLGIGLAQLVQKAGRRAPELANDAEMVQETVQQLHREIRTTSYLLHPPLLDENGLSSALQWYVEGLVERSGLDIQLDVPEDFGRLSRELELVIFRLVQESVTNIHRHSGSKTARIRIARKADAIILDVQDQGTGMSPKKLADIQSGRSGVGIRGMRERLRQFAGVMNIESGDSGTRISVMIPVSAGAGGSEATNVKPLQAAL